MIGRAAIGYPWIFNEIKHFLKYGDRPAPPDVTERVRATRKHLEFSMRWKGDRLGVFEMRKHYTNYFKALPDFKQYRMKLVEANSYEEVINILNEISEKYTSAAVAA
jgi:tRNA-dihydrouridine synthase